MCKDDPFNHLALHFSNYDQYHHLFRWQTFAFPATDDISHVTCLLFAFEYVPHMGRSQQIKCLRVYLSCVVHSKLSIYGVCILMFKFLKLNKRVSNIINVCHFVDLCRGSCCLKNVIFTLIPSNGNVYPL